MFSKLIRIGRDSELRTTQQGTSVCSIAGVYDIGWGDKKRSQWIDAVLWGKQAEALAPFLLKGVQVVIYADDVEVETYQKNGGGEGSKLKCRVVNIDLTDKKDNQSQPQHQQAAPQQQRQAPPQQQQQQAPQNQMMNNDFDEDIIPF